MLAAGIKAYVHSIGSIRVYEQDERRFAVIWCRGDFYEFSTVFKTPGRLEHWIKDRLKPPGRMSSYYGMDYDGG